MTNINTFPGDTQGRNILKSRTITHGNSGSGEVDTYTLNPGENLIILNNHQGSAGSSRTYAANFTAGIPTALGTVLHLEINSSRTNNSGSQILHRTAIQFGGTAYLDTGNIAVYSTGNAQDAYQRKLQRTIVLTVSGWVDFSLGSRVGGDTLATDIIFKTNGNVGQAATGSDSADVERMRISNVGHIGIGSAAPTQRLDVVGGIALSAVLFCQGGYVTNSYDDVTNSKRIIDTGSRYRIFHNGDSILMFSSAGGNGTLAGTTALALNGTRVGCGTTYATSYCSVRGNYSNSQAPVTYNSAPPLCVVANSGADAQPICQFRSNQGVTNIRNDGIYHKRGNGDIMALYTSSSHVRFANNTRSMILQLHSNGTAYFNCDLRADSYGNNSDDRIKHNESSIKNAIQTLFKLKPQKYDKVRMETDILEHSQYLNATDKEGYEWNDIEDGWIKRKPITSGVAQVETGLIAQDIWYDAPELRHIVNLPDDAIPDDTKPSEPDPGNIRSDPDYDSAGWGKMGPATVNYINLIPYLIKSIRELYNEVPRYKTSVSPELYSNVQDYRHMIVSRRGENIQLTNTENDKTVHGVISDIKTDTENYELLIEHTGLGNVWVINTGSNINAGDYITTSNVTGYGKLQDSAFCMNYTLAKSTIDCDFTLQTTPIKQKIRRLQDKTYWIKTQQLLDCSLMAYSNLSNDIRTTKTETYYNAYQNTHEIDEFSNVENYTLQSVMKNEEPVELTESDMDFEKYSNTYAFNTPFYTEPQTRDKYYRKQISKIDNEMEGYEPIVEQEMMDVLDDNGQVQWEDTGETRALYEMRYLTTDGSMTDQSNAVYTASLLPLVLHL